MSANTNLTLTISREQASMILQFLQHEIGVGKQIADKVTSMTNLAKVISEKLNPIAATYDIEPGT